MANIASNRVGAGLVFDYVRANWPAMVDRFGLNERYFGNMIPAITSTFSTEMRLKEMKDFFAQYPEAGAGAMARKIALERVQNNIKWLETNSKSVSDWFNENT